MLVAESVIPRCDSCGLCDEDVAVWCGSCGMCGDHCVGWIGCDAGEVV